MNDQSITRRAMLASLGKTAAAALALGVIRPDVAHAAAPPKVTVYKDPSCGCCTKWVEHLRGAGLSPTVHDRTDMDALKDSLGVPASLRSCHTAVVGKYVVEGHVPATDLQTLVTRAPADVLGIAVPGMPAGSPGMEVPGRRDHYDVIAFASNGATSLFARH